jgi:uncharacterized protein (DUF1810 family)
VGLDLVCQQMQDLLLYSARILTNMQEVMVIWCKAGDIFAIRKYPVLTFILHMVYILTDFEMMYFFIPADRYRVIVHNISFLNNCFAQDLFNIYMAGSTDLKRFIDAQERDYEMALAEINNGRKLTHWMWYIFPQIKGLGFSSTSQHYGIRNLKEAGDYLRHAVLGERLLAICRTLLELESNNAGQIFGSPDDMKLRSSMTLFAAVPETDPVFQQVLDKFFQGKADPYTITILNRH